ncbi:MAG TPA: sulfate transporter CysZ [Candidatus Ignatzschineria merdigallinarum]|uniref:Sulfate transporter CysZ n=1 Tax=Candidatus Ignatzschineria merdigallinarum TaxID=2838621 RepID=A0A9D1Q4X2_9GAMM|nr:sulfate transporter CysZ [Candidatus Ignatzschineria merdigallinarum]
MNNATHRTPKNGLQYFFEGFSIMMRPGLKRFVFMPILVNILVLGSAFTWLFFQVDSWVNYLLGFLPTWLHWLSYLLWPLILSSILLIFGYFFSTLANIIAAPFNGFLAEKVEEELSGIPAKELPWSDFVKDVPRMINRELVRLGYYLPRAIVLLIISFIPVINIISPLLWFLFGSWMMVIQYCDYAFDNHKISFTQMKETLKKDRLNNMPFGALVTLITVIPLINLFIMPAAVCGGTAMWVDRYRDQYPDK